MKVGSPNIAISVTMCYVGRLLQL